MKPDASHAELREWITQHLDPLDDNRSGPQDGDMVQNPWAPTGEKVVVRPAAVLVGLVERDRGYSVLLTKRSETLRSHTGQVALPGGRLDPGETTWQAALREAHEEIGLHPDYVTVAGLTTPYLTGTGFLVTPVVGFVREGYTLKPNADEVDEIFETPFGFLMDPANHEKRELESPQGERRFFYAMTHENRTIWGATAGMLRSLYDRLYGVALA